MNQASARQTERESPSRSLFGNLRQELQRFTPFASMDRAALDFFLTSCEQRYFAPEESLIGPADGVAQKIFFIRQGAVRSVRPAGATIGETPRQIETAYAYEVGDLLPVAAAMAARPVSATYRATQDTFTLVLPVPAMRQLAARSAPFADFLNGRVQKLLELSRQALQVAYSSQALAEQSLESPLGELVHGKPITCAPETPLHQALQTMHDRRIGAMLVADVLGKPLGILTRYDVLGRIALARMALDTPISQVMVAPVHCLSSAHTAQDAAVLMSRHGIRHVPVTHQGLLAGMVSERDLFAMQRLSLKQVSTSIRAAPDLAALKLGARGIRRFARSLLSQGVQARQLTTLVSHLNDVLTERLLQVLAAQHGVDLSRVCWLALGSEGRGEQTIATDQDNALILPDDFTALQCETARAFARKANEALDACGYPLCKGGVMAGEAACCLTLEQWRGRFAHWIEHGAPADLLNASIYFDFRALAGDARLAATLRREVGQAARSTPRFLKQMALNALTRNAPLNWLGHIDTDGHGSVDLKLQGTALYVDAARLYALAHGVEAIGTRERFEDAGRALGLQAHEFEAWVSGFEFLQILRLRVQLDVSQEAEGLAAPADVNPNRIVVDSLNDIDRRILKDVFRLARTLQQRLELDYAR